MNNENVNVINSAHMADKTYSDDYVLSIRNQAACIAKEICDSAKLKKGSILVVGCTTSEVCGEKIGTFSSPQIACAIYEGIKSVLDEKGIFLAAQCCEHLNRAIVVSRDAVMFCDIVNVVPVPKAGGSFATKAFNDIENAVCVEHIKADAGIDIGGTLIGMHLKEVAVPVKLKNNTLGSAHVTAARTRAKFIGGIRAHYDENLL